MNVENLPQIDVLVIVDVEGAVREKNLSDNVYMVDTNRHFGSGREGQAELETACKDTQRIVWWCTPIVLTNELEIVEFTGQMMEEGVCRPEKGGTKNEPNWEGVVEARGQTGEVQYSIVMKANGETMSFDPFLNING
jgi:hypothetical protein